ncbi:MAG: leucine dehydrogenase, partial [Actinomycetota bacterium]
KVHSLDADILAPCALGGTINDDTISELNCRIVAGAANNQLAFDHHGDKLRDLGILYAPDFVINAGGLINVEDELRGYDRDRAMQRVEAIYKQLQLIFAMSREKDISTARAANEYAEERIRRISRIRLVRVTEFGPISTH